MKVKACETGQNWSKLVKTGQNWSKLVKTGQNWSKLVTASDLFRRSQEWLLWHLPVWHELPISSSSLSDDDSATVDSSWIALGYAGLQPASRLELTCEQAVCSKLGAMCMWCSGAERHGGELYFTIFGYIWLSLLLEFGNAWNGFSVEMDHENPGNGPCFCPLVLHSTSFGWRLHRHQTVPDLNLMLCWPASYTCFVHVGMCRSFGEKKTKDIKDIKDIYRFPVLAASCYIDRVLTGYWQGIAHTDLSLMLLMFGICRPWCVWQVAL